MSAPAPKSLVERAVAAAVPRKGSPAQSTQDLFAPAPSATPAVAIGAAAPSPAAPALPASWRAAFDRLYRMPPPRRVRVAMWNELRSAAIWLDTNGFAVQAHGLGWRLHDLIGCCRNAPDTRWDLMGLAWLMSGTSLSGIDATGAVLVTPRGERSRFYRKPLPHHLAIHPPAAGTDDAEQQAEFARLAKHLGWILVTDLKLD